MLILVSGGSGSGKSAFAESLIADSPMARRIYLATMRVWDEEGRARVARHRALRAGKGFETVECPLDLDSAALPAGSAVLLEDLSNLLLNERFAAPGAEERVLNGVKHLADTAALAVVVTNELCSDGIRYDPDTAAYLEELSGLNRAIAAGADAVYEVACGLPICWKGGGPIC